MIRAEISKGVVMTQDDVQNMISKLQTLEIRPGKLAIPDLSERSIRVNPEPGQEPLHHTNIIVSTDYPYGRHRCMRAIWLDVHRSEGSVRFVAVTSAFGGRWNKPHAGTYVDGDGYFYYNEAGHVHWGVFSLARCHQGLGKWDFSPLDSALHLHSASLGKDVCDRLLRNREKIELRLEAK